MRSTIILLALLAILALPVALRPQGEIPLRGTFDERLSKIEQRLSALEDRLALAEEERIRAEREVPPPNLSEAKLDRLEVRVIQLESGSSGCDCDGVGQRALLDRIRSVERQVSRMRYSPNR